MAAFGVFGLGKALSNPQFGFVPEAAAMGIVGSVPGGSLSRLRGFQGSGSLGTIAARRQR